MRLLSKQEVNQEKANERRLEIDEGVKLAKKVDELRALATKEEVNLKKFRVESLKVIEKEVQDLTDRREGLRGDCETLEERKRIAQKPLDAEWQRVRHEKSSIDLIRDGLGSQERDLNSRGEKIADQEKELETERGRISDERIRSVKYLAQADEAKREADVILFEAKEREREITRNLDTREKKTIAREAEVEAVARNVERQSESNFNHEMDLGRRERALQDQIQTFIRSKQRLNG